MENASKALIIAGAILVAILLISVGILVMNSMNKPIDAASGEADSQAAQMYNSKFTIYAGKNKTATEVKQLLMAIQSNNGTDKNHYIDATIYIRPPVPVEVFTTNKNISENSYRHKATIGEIISKLERNNAYTVEVYYANLLNEGTYGYKRDTLIHGKTEKGYVAYILITNY